MSKKKIQFDKLWGLKIKKKHEKQLIPLYFFIQMVLEKNLDFNICGRKLYISMEFNVAK